jgi:hypothetical protein
MGLTLPQPMPNETGKQYKKRLKIWMKKYKI